MRLVLVGADFEENLGLGMIGAAARKSGHEVRIVPFDTPDQAAAVVERVIRARPDVVGLSVQFQHRGHEFLALARRLRRAGFRGHVTSGGQFPTLAWREVLQSESGIDSIALHEGERTVVELLDVLARRAPLADVPGLAFSTDDGVPMRTPGRALDHDLDAMPAPMRYREHTRHLGVPFIPILGGRGCWGTCTYCSITSVLRDARAYAGGRLLRLRSPANVAAEMAPLAKRAGGSAIFCFHDDNFLLPRPDDTIARVRALRAELDRRGVGHVGIVGKARPDCVTPELARALREDGVMRLYVGVENASERGAEHLGRASQTACVREALAACRDAGIFVCYNLLLFEPEATLDDVASNLAFIREHASHPVNFCRSEPYYGTPLHRALEGGGSLGGSWLGFDYRIRDDRAELCFRICAAAFRDRNFASGGVANRAMGLGYQAKILEDFHADAEGRWARLSERATEVTREISLETAGFLEEAMDLAATADLADRDRIERECVLLGLRIATADRRRHAEIDELYGDLGAFVARSRAQRGLSGRARATLQAAALGASIATIGAGCSDAVDPAPSDAGMIDAMVVDPPPPDAGMDVMVVDPLPEDAGMDAGPPVDPAPEDAGVDADIPPVDPAPSDAGMAAGSPHRLPLIDQWRDTTPRRATRTDDLPLWQPPAVALRTTVAEDGRVQVTIAGVDGAYTRRWETEGTITEQGEALWWTPAGDHDQLTVAVRTQGGIAVTSLRRRDC